MTQSTTAQKAPRSLWAFLWKGRADSAATGTRSPRGGTKKVRSTKKSIALAMMLLLPLIGIVGATSASADEENGVMKYSFYKIASSTTAFFSTVQDPDSNVDGFSEPWMDVMADPGSAGSMLGYADPSFSNVSGWLASKLSGSSDSIGYDTLLVKSEENTSVSATYRGMVDYAYFGAALKGMGLDGTSTGLSLGFMNMFSGGLVMLLYILSGAVDFLFSSAISVLDFLNPFKLFYLGVAAVNPEFAEGMVGGNTGGLGPLAGLASWIGGWYRILNTMSWAVLVPLFVGILLFSLVMFKKMDRGGAVKKLVVRIAFIGVGLPLLGTMYTGMLGAMGDGGNSGNAGSTRAVMSTYVDFESWVMKSRLEIPEGALIAWDPYAGQPTDQAQAKVRNTALAINNQSMHLGLKPIVSAGDYDASWAKQIMDGRDKEDASSFGAYSDTVDMLTRFMGNAQVSAASFETAAKGSLTQSDFYRSNSGTVKNWFESLDSDAKGLNGLDEGAEGGKIRPSLNPLVAVQPGTGLRGDSDGSGGRKFTSNTSGCYSWNALQVVGYSSGAPRSCNLSPLAMYNYLNTDFGSKSMTMYSSQNAQSEATRSIHNSVNQVGTGTMGFLYWFNTVVLLGSFVMIGLGYGFALIFSSIRRSFQIMTAVPFATLGALAAIAKVVVYTVALILEVVVTIFVYTIVQEFLISLPQIIEMPFATILNNGSTGALAGFVTFLTSGWAFGLVVTVFSIAGVIVFTVMAMRVRKMLVKAVEEAVTKLVEKFLDAPTGMPGGGKMAPALAGGLAAGAGAAASNRMMAGMPTKGAVGAATPGTGNGNGGPNGIETAGGANLMGPGPAGGAGGQLQIEGGGQLDIRESGAAGNGDPGSPAGEQAREGAGGSAADEVSLGRDVEVNGLSKPGSEDVRAPRVGDDAMSSASESVDKSVKGYAEADSKRLDSAKEGSKAVGHAAVAAGKGMAGDAAGAAESGGKAVESGGKAVAAGEEAKQREADAGRSSLDKPDQKHAEKAQKARQVSQVGGSVAKAAGSASGTSGGAAKGARATGAAPKPGSSTPSAGQASKGVSTQASATHSQRSAGQSSGSNQARKVPQQGPAPKRTPASTPTPTQAPPAARGKGSPAPRPTQRVPASGSGSTSRQASAPAPGQKQGMPVPKPASSPRPTTAQTPGPRLSPAPTPVQGAPTPRAARQAPAPKPTSGPRRVAHPSRSPLAPRNPKAETRDDSRA